MSKLGIALQALALSSMAGGYVPPSYYRRQGTYQRNPYEGKPKQRSYSPINTAALPATHAGVGAPGGGGSCSVNQTITSTTTFTVPTGCTSLIFDVWGRGGDGKTSSSLASMIGGGGGGFSRGTLGVSAGELITAKINPVMLGGYGHNYVNYVCPTASTGCGVYPGSNSVYHAAVGGCRTSVWTTATSVCALNSGIYGGAVTASAIGNLKFAGGNASAGSGNYGGSGGGAAGPDGNGVTGTPSTGVGGAGDAGSGGAGGAHGVAGTSNTTKGGGGGGSGPSSGVVFGPGNGGFPGGGGGGSRSAGIGSGAGGQIIIHSSSLEEDRINNAGGSYGGGTVSMS